MFHNSMNADGTLQLSVVGYLPNFIVFGIYALTQPDLTQVFTEKGGDSEARVHDFKLVNMMIFSCQEMEDSEFESQ